MLEYTGPLAASMVGMQSVALIPTLPHSAGEFSPECGWRIA